MTSWPGVSLACSMAQRSEPSPASRVLVTTKAGTSRASSGSPPGEAARGARAGVCGGSGNDGACDATCVGLQRSSECDSGRTVRRESPHADEIVGRGARRTDFFHVPGFGTVGTLRDTHIREKSRPARPLEGGHDDVTGRDSARRLARPRARGRPGRGDRAGPPVRDQHPGRRPHPADRPGPAAAVRLDGRVPVGAGAASSSGSASGSTTWRTRPT